MALRSISLDQRERKFLVLGAREMICKKGKQLYILSPEMKTRPYQYPRIKTPHPPHALVLKRTPNVITLEAIIYRRF